MGNTKPDESVKTYAEFFAGIGLVHSGLQASGWDCVYANDIESKKKVMYEAEHGESSHYHVEDIWNTDFILDHLVERPFLATASFPCVDLSLAGHWRGFKGEHSSTYFGFLEVLRRLENDRPKVVMLENVYGFLTSHNGADFERAVIELAELGYWIDALVVDARWFVPQSRPRLFVFGFHDSFESDLIIRRSNRFNLEDPWLSAVDHTAVLRPNGVRPAIDKICLPSGWAALNISPPTQCDYCLDQVLDNDSSQDWWDEGATLKHYAMMETPSRNRVEEYIRSGGTAVGTAFRRTRRGKTRLEVRFDIAGCLRTPKGGSAKQIIVAIDKGKIRMRWMSAREYARLQGVGGFNITVPPLQAMYGFGDAVCVPVIEWIDRNILTPVYESCYSGLTRTRV